MDFNDDYPTCETTYATLCIYREDLDPDAVSSALGVVPSDHHRKGDLNGSAVMKSGGWFLTSKEQVQSKDAQRHIVWILDQLADKVGMLLKLRDEGCRMEISCYWLSAQGHDGPTLSPELMRRLAEAELTIWFDFYRL